MASSRASPTTRVGVSVLKVAIARRLDIGTATLHNYLKKENSVG